MAPLPPFHSPQGLDFLTFLAATVLVIPVFKSAKQSPVLGFLFAGVVMGQLGCAAPAGARGTGQRGPAEQGLGCVH